MVFSYITSVRVSEYQKVGMSREQSVSNCLRVQTLRQTSRENTNGIGPPQCSNQSDNGIRRGKNEKIRVICEGELIDTARPRSLPLAERRNFA
jgi:hypothetical protein